MQRAGAERPQQHEAEPEPRRSRQYRDGEAATRPRPSRAIGHAADSGSDAGPTIEPSPKRTI